MLVPAALALVAGAWAGLARLDVVVPTPPGDLITAHGPLMVSGFLGTLIGVERAVALGRPWGYAAPLLSGGSAVVLVLGGGAVLGPDVLRWGTALGSAVLVAVFAALLAREPTPHVAAMAAGATAWLGGNVVWAAGLPVARATPLWVAFLVLTIAGERLELTRALPFSGARRATAAVALGWAAIGAVVQALAPVAGARLGGAGTLAVSLWLLRHDIARRTVRQKGLTRFIAVCLLPGYVWLAVCGILTLAFPGATSGPLYDAPLHAAFLGFALSMVFGHAPVIFPAVLGVAVPYRPRFYAHVALLHSTVALRVAGDLGGWPALRQWGGVGNVAAILLFVASTAAAAGSGRSTSRPPDRRPERAPTRDHRP